MRVTNTSRLLTVAALLAVMAVGPLATAVSAPKTISKVSQPDGKPHKPSSFAPRPTRTRVFGAPIQPPILKKVPPKESPPK